MPLNDSLVKLLSGFINGRKNALRMSSKRLIDDVPDRFD
jgi:hypothetical protein